MLQIFEDLGLWDCVGVEVKILQVIVDVWLSVLISIGENVGCSVGFGEFF